MTTHDPATFAEAVAYANETGWIIYQLNQACDPTDHPWRCTLRESEGSARRRICNGKGASPEGAIFDALAEAPELEPEASTVDNLRPLADLPTISALLGIPAKPTLVITRRG